MERTIAAQAERRCRKPIGMSQMLVQQQLQRQRWNLERAIALLVFIPPKEKGIARFAIPPPFPPPPPTNRSRNEDFCHLNVRKAHSDWLVRMLGGNGKKEIPKLNDMNVSHGPTTFAYRGGGGGKGTEDRGRGKKRRKLLLDHKVS